jgi:hypothetical protein
MPGHIIKGRRGKRGFRIRRRRMRGQILKGRRENMAKY